MHEARVLRSEPAGTLLRLIELDHVPPGYQRPGQYALVSEANSRPAPFAFASSPGERALFLAKQEGEAGIALGSVPPGQTVLVGDALGDGFPLARVVGRPLVVLCNGSGISAARPVVRAEVAAGLPRPVAFFYGVLSPDRRSFVPDLDAWTAAGVSVHTVLDPDLVQLAAEREGWLRAEVGVVLVGVPQMLADARARFRAVGVPDERILVNF